ncbi:Uncharacterized protein PBTT_07737 [Plasmodiophora brassicae]
MAAVCRLLTRDHVTTGEAVALINELEVSDADVVLLNVLKENSTRAAVAGACCRKLGDLIAHGRVSQYVMRSTLMILCQILSCEQGGDSGFLCGDLLLAILRADPALVHHGDNPILGWALADRLRRFPLDDAIAADVKRVQMHLAAMRAGGRADTDA